MLQEVNANETRGQKHNSGAETKGDYKLSVHGNSLQNSKVNVNFGGTDRRRQNKGNNKTQSSNKQRLFHSNFRNHNNRNHHGALSESPPVGFFFGSTPPDNNGFVLCLIMLINSVAAGLVPLDEKGSVFLQISNMFYSNISYS